MKQRILLALSAAVVTAFTVVGVAIAGSAHFVGTPTLTISGNSLTVSGKVAGLGNIPQITTTVSGTAECVNPGSNKPKAANKQSFSAESNDPVQNGKADFSVTATATFQPDCTPPMTVVFSGVTVTVTSAFDPDLFLQFTF